MIKKINTIELFSGCGGFLEGFEKQGSFRTLACVEWEKAPCDNLINRLEKKWKHNNAKEEVIRFDIQRTNELFYGFNDKIYGYHKGLDELVKGKYIDIIIGGPPCQAYSYAGRVSDKNGMRNDYRNYLFESYVKVVKHYKPKLFLFENVQGMLSAAPNGKLIINEMKDSFKKAGYLIRENIDKTIFNMVEYGVPQNRKRVIILGINESLFGDKSSEILEDFYDNMMLSLKQDRKTVKDAIGDLPPLYPLEKEIVKGKIKISHENCNIDGIFNHSPRYHNKRDIEIFKLLAEDIAKGIMKYKDPEKLKELYKKETGKKSNVHKYYVLRSDEASNTIPAHLNKDGLRHIHPDYKQARSITVREAARLQTFDDDYEFIGGKMNQYKMIGNAVPPKFSFILATAIKKLFDKYNMSNIVRE